MSKPKLPRVLPREWCDSQKTLLPRETKRLTKPWSAFGLMTFRRSFRTLPTLRWTRWCVPPKDSTPSRFAVLKMMLPTWKTSSIKTNSKLARLIRLGSRPSWPQRTMRDLFRWLNPIPKKPLRPCEDWWMTMLLGVRFPLKGLVEKVRTKPASYQQLERLPIPSKTKTPLFTRECVVR